MCKLNYSAYLNKGGNMARVLISMSNDFLSKVDNVASSEQRTISNNLKAKENATILTELLA